MNFSVNEIDGHVTCAFEIPWDSALMESLDDFWLVAEVILRDCGVVGDIERFIYKGDGTRLFQAEGDLS